jgi:hypothetical protein
MNTLDLAADRQILPGQNCLIAGCARHAGDGVFPQAYDIYYFYPETRFGTASAICLM